MAFLLGKPLKPGTVLAEVERRLAARSVAVSIHLPEGAGPPPDWTFAARLVVQRGLGVAELTAALALEYAGVRCLNRIDATLTLHDRALTVRTLAEAGVPAPAMIVVDSWTEVRERVGGRPIVVKATEGTTGRGLGVYLAPTGELPLEPPFAGPYLVQDYIANDGRDYKLYVAGGQARGLIKRWPPRRMANVGGAPFAVDAALTELARRTGKALGLEIYGVDVVFGPDGPVVVDVNPFPGFRGVARAAAQITRVILEVVRREPVSCFSFPVTVRKTGNGKRTTSRTHNPRRRDGRCGAAGDGG